MNCKYLKSSLTAIVLVLGVLLGVSTTAWAQQPGKRTITGTVVDETNQPLPGVTIIVEGTTTGTITDFDGNYSIVLTEEAENLQFSYIGYQSQTVPVPQANQLNV